MRTHCRVAGHDLFCMRSFYSKNAKEPIRRTTAVPRASEGRPETSKVTPNVRHTLTAVLTTSCSIFTVFLKTGFIYPRLYREGSQR